MRNLLLVTKAAVRILENQIRQYCINHISTNGIIFILIDERIVKLVKDFVTRLDLMGHLGSWVEYCFWCTLSVYVQYWLLFPVLLIKTPWP
jgi:hypothetical protein